ncbi:hypothetical protein [Nocardia camponoti]|uniref:Uncharacterized protein n=1 Tax=Nocardia camponoti TaxID=1616106 RepID=A0A917QU85_9NOCA|nr:hypothetical protein [Nocardia camponoti]GGK69061.1 hypothetical protein GCM10011591_46490 [Nocardia camponoti]
MTNQWILTNPDTDDYVEADAPTAALAVGAVRRKYARYDLTDVRERTVRAVLEVSHGGHRWQSYLPGVVHRDGDWLVLDGATALSLDGVVQPEGLTNYRYLRGIWATNPNVRFDNTVSVLLDAPAPERFDEVIDALSWHGPIDDELHHQVRVELGVEDRTVRVAYRDSDSGGWRIAMCPARVLGVHDAELAAVPGLTPDHDLVVVDQVSGFPAGCATWSRHDDAESDEYARAEHLGCAHDVMFLTD